MSGRWSRCNDFYRLAVAALALESADTPALRLDDITLNWSQLGERIDRLAAGFQSQGVRDGDGVMLLAHNHPQTLLARAGAASVRRPHFAGEPSASPTAAGRPPAADDPALCAGA